MTTSSFALLAGAASLAALAALSKPVIRSWPINLSANLTALTIAVVVGHRLVGSGQQAWVAGAAAALIASTLAVVMDRHRAGRRNRHGTANLFSWMICVPSTGVVLAGALASFDHHLVVNIGTVSILLCTATGPAVQAIVTRRSPSRRYVPPAVFANPVRADVARSIERIDRPSLGSSQSSRRSVASS